jgi:hypothetical protein
VTKPYQDGYIDRDMGREAYLQTQNKFVPVVALPKQGKQEDQLQSIRWEERLASLIAAGGTMWAVYVATVDYTALWQMKIMPPGLVEVCGLGILMWLHAKWRRSMKN